METIAFFPDFITLSLSYSQRVLSLDYNMSLFSIPLPIVSKSGLGCFRFASYFPTLRISLISASTSKCFNMLFISTSSHFTLPSLNSSIPRTLVVEVTVHMRITLFLLFCNSRRRISEKPVHYFDQCISLEHTTQ